MSTWDDFLHWAARIDHDVDVIGEERDYKIAIAGTIRDACHLAAQGDPSWCPSFGKAISAGNLLSWQVVDDTKRTIESRPDEMRDAVAGLWQAADPAPAVGRFVTGVEAAGLTGKPGGVTSLASIILMGRDSGQFPPYRTEFVRRWVRAVGESSGDESPSGQYGTLIRLCDELLRRAPVAGLDVADRLEAQGLAWATLQRDPPARWSPLDRASLAALRNGQGLDAVVVERGSGRAPEIEAAAWLILDPGLHGGASPLDPAVTTWTAEVATDLLAHIGTDPGGGSLWDRFAAQLAGAADATVLLAAELMCLRLLPIDTIKPETKLQQVNRILSWAPHPRALPADLEAGLRADGAFGGGMGYNQQAVQHIQWLCRFIQAWTGLSEGERDRALRDPWDFIAMTAAVPDDVPTARYTLEYLAWPGLCPPVVSGPHRKLIHDNLMADIGDPTGNDEVSRTRDLVSLWAHHRGANPEKPGWYDEPFVSRWRPGAAAGPRAWLVRSGEGGSALVEQWVADGFVSLKAHMLGDLPAGASEREVRAAVKSGYMHLDATQQDATTRAYHWFLSVMKTDDLVATLDQGVLRIGMVIGEPEYVDSKEARLRRDVAWSPQSVAAGELPGPITARLEQQGSVVDLTSAYDELASLVDVERADDSDVTVLTARRDQRSTADSARDVAWDQVPRLPAVSAELAEELYMPRADLQEMVDLLQDRQQVVFFGPPGTGKTYIAKKLAHHLVGDPSHYRLVQFHPSYTYEDFFEGYRPVLTESGEATFKLMPGPLKQLVSECEAPGNRGEPYILIIDEMNRANLAKVFGELYFLLEYRNETVQLQYQEAGSTPFSLPRNLFIIGTMNTTDRSIALVDAAIRRRFPFYELHPGEAPVADVLRKYLRRNGLPDERARLLDALNLELGEPGRDLHIGPSYFMRSGTDGEDDLERIWRYYILPLLEEHFYGQLDRETIRERFGLGTIRRQAAHDHDVADDSMSDPERAEAGDSMTESPPE